MVKHVCQKSSMECLTCISFQPCISFQGIFTNAFNYFKIFFYSNINSRSKWRKVAFEYQYKIIQIVFRRNNSADFTSDLIKNKKKSGYMYFNYKTNQIMLTIMLIKQNQSYLVLIFMNAKLSLYLSLSAFFYSVSCYTWSVIFFWTNIKVTGCDYQCSIT